MVKEEWPKTLIVRIFARSGPFQHLYFGIVERADFFEGLEIDSRCRFVVNNDGITTSIPTCENLAPFLYPRYQWFLILKWIRNLFSI